MGCHITHCRGVAAGLIAWYAGGLPCGNLCLWGNTDLGQHIVPRDVQLQRTGNQEGESMDRGVGPTTLQSCHFSAHLCGPRRPQGPPRRPPWFPRSGRRTASCGLPGTSCTDRTRCPPPPATQTPRAHHCAKKGRRHLKRNCPQAANTTWCPVVPGMLTHS